MMNSVPVTIDGSNLTVDMVNAVARDGRPVNVKQSSLEAINACRDVLQDLIDQGVMIYGITTGMGGMREFLVPKHVAPEMQMNLLRSVASNVGDPFPDEVVRATMLARLNSLARGHSAIQLSNFMVLLDMLNAHIHPLVPMKGSLGASGDLGPLASIALAATGEGMVHYHGKTLLAAEALEDAGIKPMQLDFKEGLALINGTSMMAGMGALVINDMEIINDTADVVAALTTEALTGRLGPFDERVHAQKPHPGQQVTATNIVNLTQGSRMAISEEYLQQSIGERHSNESTRKSDMLIMDAYSIRCVPHVHGPAKECTSWSRDIVQRELNSSNDDPLVLAEHRACFHNGHFHGQYIAMVMDSVAVAATTIGLMSDRRIDRYMDQNHSSGLPPFLCTNNAGVRMGLMGGQFMTSSLMAENRAKCTPLSVQSIPSTEDFQDFVSMGLVGTRRTYEVVRDTAYVLAFELVCAAQAADIRGADKLSPIGRKTYELTRELCPSFDVDMSVTPFVEKIAASILDGQYAAILTQDEEPDTELVAAELG
ncbi:MAG TPA: aromatic amino acid lyase [Pyrinomonadaceae bacterium]|nr:aromatic amino acid lyase [Pyrinomonadaceae bacterium]